MLGKNYTACSSVLEVLSGEPARAIKRIERTLSIKYQTKMIVIQKYNYGPFLIQCLVVSCAILVVIFIIILRANF